MELELQMANMVELEETEDLESMVYEVVLQQ